MPKDKRVLTRRDFLRVGTGAAVGGFLGLPLLDKAAAGVTSKSRVVLVRDKGVLDSSGRVQGEVLERMLDQAVVALTETPDAASAWNQVARPDDIVGIKSNAWSYLPTPEPLERAIQMRLREIGVKAEHMAVGDRGILKNRVFKSATALINTRPMRTHHWSGLGTLIKNYIMFTPRPWDYHDNACENLGSIWKFPEVAGKTRLNILVMLTPQFHGVGPHSFSQEHVWNYCGLIVSTDPVAADATGARIIQAKRQDFFGRERPISPHPHHIVFADTKFGLGNSQADRIEIVRLGWQEGSLL